MGARFHKGGFGGLLLAAGAVVLFAAPAWAGWRDQASPDDINRLVQLPSIRARALHAAETWPGQGDFKALQQVMEADGRTLPARDMLGNWRCREMKLGGVSPYIVYRDWFRCNIRYVNGGLLFQKVTGTQRAIGFLYPQQGAWVYLGASSEANEPWHNYSGRTPAIGAQVTPDDQIGLLTGIGDNHLRLEMPAVQESLIDVIELKR